jgi:hypothetical protein
LALGWLALRISVHRNLKVHFMAEPHASHPSALRIEPLLQLIFEHAEQRGDPVAIRHKQRGRWHERRWRGLLIEIEKVQSHLAARGFRAGDGLFATDDRKPEALVVLLAALALGGTVIPLASLGEAAAVREVEGNLFASVSDFRELDALTRQGRGNLRFAILRDGHGFAGGPSDAVGVYADLVRSDSPTPARSGDQLEQGAAGSFSFVVGSKDGETKLELVSTAGLVEEARLSVVTSHLRLGAELWVDVGLPFEVYVRKIFVPWLVAGAALNVGEVASTADSDRRELSPSLLAFDGAAFAELAHRVEQNSQAKGSILRSWNDIALGSTLGPSLGFLADWVVRRPLRALLGLRRAERVIVFGAVPDASLDLLRKLEVPFVVTSVDESSALDIDDTDLAPSSGPGSPLVSGEFSTTPSLGSLPVDSRQVKAVGDVGRV